MVDVDSAMVIYLSGPGWHAALDVEAPTDEWQHREFDVPLSHARNAKPYTVPAYVRYTRAANRLEDGWRQWHVKVYRCRTVGDAEKLRLYLRRQAINILQANAELPGTTRIPIDPPWAVVPVHIVRCDGQEDNLGTRRTELGRPAEVVVAKMRATLPSWLVDDPPTPENYLLAISPYMEQLSWDERRDSPGTELLADFAGMAAGLDILHRLGTAHCDIKPENVCRYGTYEASGYVLIDADATAQLQPPPVTIRTTPRYEHGAITAWRDNQAVRGLGFDPGLLKAHDRFGFALIVLIALAGRDWVDQVLLRHHEDDSYRRRPADERRAVRAALRRLWADTPDRNWAPLIDALVEPFGPEIESDRWSAAEWLERLRQEERRCVVTERQALPLRVGFADRYRNDLERIRQDALRVPSRRPDTTRRGLTAIERGAFRVAFRSALKALVLWSTTLCAVTAIVLISVLWLRK